jgi:predicted transcriptional regulator
MGKLSLTAVFCIVFLVILALFPMACPFATMDPQNPPARHSMPGGTGCGMCAKMQNQQASRAVPTNSAAQQPMPSPASTFFRCEIMNSLQNTQAFVRRRLSGIRRILRTNVCDNKNRKAIYDLILVHSGIDHAELSKRTGLNKETLRYHLAVLASVHKISVMRDGGSLYYFENNGVFAITEDRKIAIHMRGGTTRTILELLEQRPGVHQGELAGIIRVTAPTIIWHIRKLTRDGFVQEERQGKTIRYALTPDGVLVLAKFRNRSSTIPTMVQDPAVHAG